MWEISGFATNLDFWKVMRRLVSVYVKCLKAGEIRAEWWFVQAGESVILKDELGEPAAVERSTTIYRDCFRSRPVDPIPTELLPRAVAARMRETTFRLDDGRPAVYSCTSNDAFRPYHDHRISSTVFRHNAATVI